MAKKILVVDDELDMLETLRFTLERDGFDVTGVATSSTALEKAKALKPDLVILDLLMPGINGTTLLNRLKQDEATRSIPVLILSIKDKDESIHRSQIAGYIVKPFEHKSLLRQIKQVLGEGEKT